jgi:hypothetical protein
MKKLVRTDNMMLLIRRTGLLPEILNDAGMNALPKWRALRRSFALFAGICRRL